MISDKQFYNAVFLGKEFVTCEACNKDLKITEKQGYDPCNPRGYRYYKYKAHEEHSELDCAKERIGRLEEKLKFL